MMTAPSRNGQRRNTPRAVHVPETRGQALTEFILVIPLFFLLLLGVVQLSMLSFAQQVVHYAAFAATRAAIVRPCMAFHPDDDDAPHFTPAVFSAAVLSTLAAAPAQDLTLGGLPYTWLPGLPPESAEVQGLDFEEGTGLAKYVNAAYLTAVRRVEPDFDQDPVAWEANDPGPGHGRPCVNWWTPDTELTPQQNVPPTARDLTLEVTFLYPMRIPIVNRVFYGIFVNFTGVAQEDLGLGFVREPGGPIEDVMVLPIRTLPSMERYRTSVARMVDAVMAPLPQGYGFSSASESAGIGGILQERQWYPLPVRARCTLTVEGAMMPLTTFHPLVP